MTIQARLLAIAVAGTCAIAVPGPVRGQALDQLANDVAIDGVPIAPDAGPVAISAGRVVATGAESSAVIHTGGPCGSISVGPNLVVEITQALLDGTDCTLVAVNSGGELGILAALGLVPLAFIDFGDDDEDQREAASE